MSWWRNGIRVLVCVWGGGEGRRRVGSGGEQRVIEPNSFLISESFCTAAYTARYGYSHYINRSLYMVLVIALTNAGTGINSSTLFSGV